MYQLENIQRLINVDLGKKDFPIEELQAEKARIMQNFDSILCSEDNSSKFIQLHQHKLLALMNKVASYQPKDDSLKDTIYCCLKDLLDYLESYSPACMNIKVKVPSWYLEYQCSDDDIDFISDNLNKMELDHEYWAILMRPLYDLIASKVNPCQFTDKQIFYLKVFNHGLKSLFTTHDQCLHQKLDYLLISLNFNNVRYLDYKKVDIAAALDEIPDTREKLVQLNWYLSEINSLPVKADFSFDDKLASLKDLLKTWLADKITFWEGHMKLAIADSVPADLLQFQHVKINIQGSVDAFAYFLGMAFETKLITNENRKEVAAVLAYFISTSKQGNIAKGSLLRKSYGPNSCAEKSVRKVLEELLKFKRRE